MVLNRHHCCNLPPICHLAHADNISMARPGQARDAGVTPHQAAQSRALLCTMESLVMGCACTGEYSPEWEWLVSVMRSVARMSAVSAPLAVELFCSGVLGMLLHVAQRWVAALPHGHQDIVVSEFIDALSFVFGTFSLAVPQARAHLLRPAAQAVSCSLLMVVQCMRRLSACRLLGLLRRIWER